MTVPLDHRFITPTRRLEIDNGALEDAYTALACQVRTLRLRSLLLGFGLGTIGGSLGWLAFWWLG